ALRNARKNGDTRWLMYWTVFAVFSFIDNFAEIITKHFPIYWLLKAFFFFCLYFPDGRGSWMLYKRYVNPAIAMIDDCIDAYQNRRNTTAEQKRQISSNE
ncbi:Receptor expression-enhancing protein 4, partial [Toxocara canis]